MKTKIQSWSYHVEDSFDADSGFTQYTVLTKGLKDVFVDFKHLSHIIELYLGVNYKEFIYKWKTV